MPWITKKISIIPSFYHGIGMLVPTLDYDLGWNLLGSVKMGYWNEPILAY